MALYIRCRVGAGLFKISSSNLDRSYFQIHLRFCSAMDKSNSSSDSVSGKSCSASSYKSGQPYCTGMKQTVSLDNKTRNSLENQTKSDRNDKQTNCDAAFDYEDEFPPLSAGTSSSRSKVSQADRKGKGDHSMTKPTLETHVVFSPKELPSVSPSSTSFLTGDGFVSPTSSKSSQVSNTRIGKKKGWRQINIEKSLNGKNASEKNAVGSKHSDFRKTLTKVERLHICSLPLAKKDCSEKTARYIDKNSLENTAGDIDGASRVLRSGMVLLKSYISLPEQVQVVKTCNQLGYGPGGFYRPGYEDGAKLRLYMMCLGQNWDPQTRYNRLHPVDNCEVPGIPEKFIHLVKRSIQDAHALMKDSEEGDVTRILPSMSPDICIANFYTKSGRLGLHQDRDESSSSRCKGLPVVSISIGDSAVFLLGDESDADKAEEVVLESGDVLLFGGKSRMVFHGVANIIPNTAPAMLREGTGLTQSYIQTVLRVSSGKKTCLFSYAKEKNAVGKSQNSLIDIVVS